MTNVFSPHWFSTFMDTLPGEWTKVEVEGVRRRLPLPEFERVLDVCCGTGRHAEPLSAAGYEVTGVDRDPLALQRARHAAPGARFIQLDQRELNRLEDPFDAAIILWQSFGLFDTATNDGVLRALAALLRPRGRLLIDLFHPGALTPRQAAPRAEGRATIFNSIEGGRLISTIEYTDGFSEKMDFELFTPEDLAARARRAGFETLEQCCWWDETRPPDPSVRRYQTVLERA